MSLFTRKSDKAKPLSVAPGMYADEKPEQLIFDRTTRLAVERNHWKIAMLGIGFIALAAIMTRESPPSIVKVVGVSTDATGKPYTRELTEYRPDEQALKWAAKDIVTRWFTIEPILTTDVEHSRLAQNLRSVREQMVGSSRQQFQEWFDDDQPVHQIVTSPTLVREPKILNIAVLPDSTVAVEFVTSTSDEGYKPRKQRYAITFRYQTKPPNSDAILGTNPFGIYPVFFSIQKSQA